MPYAALCWKDDHYDLRSYGWKVWQTGKISGRSSDFRDVDNSFRERGRLNAHLGKEKFHRTYGVYIYKLSWQEHEVSKLVIRNITIENYIDYIHKSL